MADNYGLQLSANPKRNLFQEFGGKKYARYPVNTPFFNLGDSLEDFIDSYLKKDFQESDILCISAKVVSIANKFVVHESEVSPSWLAKLIVKFVKKWPNDPGYANPRKMQVAINQAGYFRMIIALIVGTFLKIFGIKGYFYRIAGNQINAIDGFTSGPISGKYAILPPKDSDGMCNKFEDQYGIACAIIDGNNIENNILGMGDRLKKYFDKKTLMHVLQGNPQCQEDEGVRTPMLLVREIKQ